ncbi:MAG: 50S ribosomal protein L4 [Oligoflexia bacterium]|nr:50S ribosomal protein L4 [Oligoflexia bacterium]
METKIVNTQGKKVGDLKLDPAIFDAPELPFLIHDTVRWQRARARAGTHSSLRKAEVSGGGKKPWRQKGTGRARAGSNTSPLWVGGGVIFGPKPRDYDFRFNKRERRKALTSALSFKNRNGELIVVDKLDVTSGKTKDFVAMLEQLGIGKNSVTVLMDNVKAEGDKQTVLAARNLPRVRLLGVAGTNVYDLLKHKFLLCTEAGLKALSERLSESKQVNK